MATYKAKANIVNTKCQVIGCLQYASFDCIYEGRWGYVCTDHFMQGGNPTQALVNNISGHDITIGEKL